MADDAQDLAALAKRFFDAIEQGDIETVAGIYAENAIIWHNTDRAGSSRAENLDVLSGFIRRAPTRRYTERRLSVFADGFAHQHVLKAIRADGFDLTLPACIICAVSDGRITRLDEYFDSAALKDWFV